MREKSLKIIIKSLFFPIGASLFGCTHIYQRPTSLVYPKAQNSQPQYAAYQTNYGYYQVPTNQTFVSNTQTPNYQPVQRQNYVNIQPIQQQNFTPQQKIQTNALISQNQVEKVIPTNPTSTNSTIPTSSTPTPTIPEKEEVKEDVILEEVIYIPSALQTTPVDEIEILSESKVPVETISKEEDKKETSKPQIINTPTVAITENKESTQQITLKEPVKQDIPPKPITTGKQPTIENTKVEKTPEPRKAKKVKVYKGDTLYSIAQRNNIKVYELADHNNLKAPFTLKLGQTIEIPGDKPVAQIKKPEIITNLNTTKTFIEEPKKDFVVIKKGDTIYSIAKQNNVPLKDIILRNNLRAPYTLSIGDKIYIPNTAFHIVKAQDTAYSISRKYNVNLNSLVKLNKLTEPYTLSIGQKILLPATNIDVVQKQIKYVVKDKETAKTVQPSLEKEEVKEVSKIRVAQKQKIEEKPKEIQTQTEIEKKEIIKSIIVKPEPLTSKRFLWPLNGKVISQYGIKNNGKRNDGINISAKLGSPVIAAENGIVAYAGNELKGLGNLVIIKHDKDFMTIYAHNETILVRKGDNVKRGDNIATVGKTGRVTTPQLHFEIREKTKSVNPTDVLESK